MILYSEDMLSKVYRIYQLHQAKHDLGFMQYEDFRVLFEQQEIIVNEIEEEEADGDSSY